MLDAKGVSNSNKQPGTIKNENLNKIEKEFKELKDLINLLIEKQENESMFQ